MADPRKMMTRREYQVERTALVAMFLDIRSGRHGAKTEMYRYGGATAAATIRSVFYHRRNRTNRS